MKILIRLLARFSLLVFPHSFDLYWKYFKGYLSTYRFFCKAKLYHSSGFIAPPFTYKGEKSIYIGKNFVAGYNFRIECWHTYNGEKFSPTIHIGDNVCFNNNCHIGAINKILIGDNVLVGSNVLITDHGHGQSTRIDLEKKPADRNLYSKGEIVIEDSVWIGENVCIMPGVHIGCHSVIGANSVVTSNVPSYSIIVGNPARAIKSLL